MTFSIGMIGAGQFAPSFAELFQRHPGVDRVVVTDLVPERAAALVDELGLAGTAPDADALLGDPSIDAIAVFTQRWTHGPTVVDALRAGKHVYSAVPMAATPDEAEAIIREVERSGLTYMMGETSFYNPATVYARSRYAAGDFGRVFYLEGDYVHDMDLGFYDAYRFSGGDAWKSTASFPPMWYPTHSIGGVLGAIPTHAIGVSCVGIRDDRADGVFDRDVSIFGNDFSNMSALFELDGGGAMRINELRRVGYPSARRESRFRFFGTEGSFEQLVTTALWMRKDEIEDVTELLEPSASMDLDDPRLAEVAPELRPAFVSGHARVHEPLIDRLPAEFIGAPNGHEGSHQLLSDDFVRAVTTGTLPPVNAWVAARFTVPGHIAYESARRSGERLTVPDFGDAPVAVGEPLA